MTRPHERAPAAPDEQGTDFSTLAGLRRSSALRYARPQVRHRQPVFPHARRRAERTHRDRRATLLNFSSYDYLGLNGHPRSPPRPRRPSTAMASRPRRAGSWRASARCIARSNARLAGHYGVEDSLVFVSGYATNLGVIGHLVGPRTSSSTTRSHNSIVMGGVLSGAARRAFRITISPISTRSWRTPRAVRTRPDRGRGALQHGRRLPGSAAPDRHQERHEPGSWSMRPMRWACWARAATASAEHFGVDPRDVDIWMGTLSKTLAGCGGYIAGCPAGRLPQIAVGVFVYSVGDAAADRRGGRRALESCIASRSASARLQRNGRFFRAHARILGARYRNGCGAAIAPIIIGDSLPTALLSARLYERGFNTMPVIYPACRRGRRGCASSSRRTTKRTSSKPCSTRRRRNWRMSPPASGGCASRRPIRPRPAR